MTATKIRTSSPSSRRKKINHFETLSGYMSKMAQGTLNKHSIFTICVKASLSKCFEFNLAVQQRTTGKYAYFTMSSLRGICEDLIVLRYIRQMPATDRQDLLLALAGQELNTRIKLQDTFFAAFRPQQPVLRRVNVEAAITSNEAAARAVWNRHGWPNLKTGAMPQIRQIAEKQGLQQLAVLYDYLYRLTSAGVHFNVQSLLRSGWGPTPRDFSFSTKHFQPYFADYCSLYGSFMFCLYFEFFASVLRPSPNERKAIDRIRQDILMTRRWPEMVTFEEMNIDPPANGETLRMIMSAFQAISRKRLISKGVDYRTKRSAESRRMLGLLKELDTAVKRPRRIRSAATATDEGVIRG